MQEVAGKLRFAEAAAMGRFGRIAGKPLYRLIMGTGGKLPRQEVGPSLGGFGSAASQPALLREP